MRALGASGTDDGRNKLFQLQRDILLHILDLDFHIRDKAPGHQKTTANDFLDIASIPEARVVQWYEQALLIVEKAKALPVTSEVTTEGGVELGIPGGLAKMYRESYLGALLAEICPDKQFSPRRSMDEAKRCRRMSLSRPGSMSFPLPLEELQTSTKMQGESERALEEDVTAGGADLSASPEVQPPETELMGPVLFGHQAPNIPDIAFRVFDVDAIDVDYVADTPSAARLDTMDVTQKYSYLRNASGYVHVFQDTDEIMRMISEALTSWEDMRGAAESQVCCMFPMCVGRGTM